MAHDAVARNSPQHTKLHKQSTANAHAPKRTNISGGNCEIATSNRKKTPLKAVKLKLMNAQSGDSTE